MDRLTYSSDEKDKQPINGILISIFPKCTIGSCNPIEKDTKGIVNMTELLDQKMTKAVELHGQLLEKIISGRLAPGTKLNEKKLAEQYGVSRTPVREALKHLASSNLVVMEPHKGVVVAGITIEQLTEMFEAMAEMEAACARLCAMRMTAKEKKQLTAIHLKSEHLTDDQDIEIYQDLNSQFHTAIFEGCHNRILAENAKSLRSRLDLFRRLQFQNMGRLAKSYSEHNSVVQAILSDNPELAYHAMRFHMTSSKQSFTDYAKGLQ